MSQGAEIRQMHLVEGVSKKELARRFGLDVRTVRRAVSRTEPATRRASRRRGRALDACRAEIVQWLRMEPRTTAKKIGLLLGGRAGQIRSDIRTRYELSRAMAPTETRD